MEPVIAGYIPIVLNSDNTIFIDIEKYPYKHLPMCKCTLNDKYFPQHEIDDSYSGKIKGVFFFQLFSKPKKYKKNKNIINDIKIIDGSIDFKSLIIAVKKINDKKINDKNEAKQYVIKLLELIKSQYKDLINYKLYKYKNYHEEYADDDLGLDYVDDNLNYDDIIF